MRILNETEKYLDSINTQSEEKEVKSTEDLLSNVAEVFGTLTSAVKDLEAVMTALQGGKEEEVVEEKEEVIEENIKEED